MLKRLVNVISISHTAKIRYIEQRSVQSGGVNVSPLIESPGNYVGSAIIRYYKEQRVK